MLTIALCENHRVRKMGNKLVSGPCFNRAHTIRTLWTVTKEEPAPQKHTIYVCWECAVGIDKLRYNKH